MAKNSVTTKSTKKIKLDDLHGVIPIRMTNDYLFRALMQRNTNVLKSLICSLLHLDPDDVISVTILNPIELGETIDDKNYILDIKVELNGHTTINLEMQVINEGNWPERSLCYLCRVFDNLNRGEDYEDVHPAIQIGLLDFTLFEDSPEFFANYYLMNSKNHRIYSDKFRLSVLDLTQIDLATKEDRAYQIDRWAALFKATTWEELKMLAENNQSIEDAVTTVRQLTQEEKIRQQCEAREDYYRRTAGREKLLKKTTMERDELKEQLSQKDAEIAKKDVDIAKKDAEIEHLRSLLAK
ncbi:MAG: Rpn family recombination-promoting nuclease/putative transposase [Lachnospiraceae bacterium]|nr:Rpn family recombination-promoting nuclease/putative transposase [Lachnospiraceae bacterium]